MSSPAQLRQQATQRYRPVHVKVLFVAESPPSAPDRHFYFEHVTRADTLWIELMRALYPGRFGETRVERQRKGEWLQTFQQDGYWMIEAIPDPLDSRRKEIQIAEHADRVLALLADTQPAHVVLIAAPVWKVLQDPVRTAGYSLPQTQAIPFPGRGQQRNFRHALGDTLATLGIHPL